MSNNITIPPSSESKASELVKNSQSESAQDTGKKLISDSKYNKVPFSVTEAFKNIRIHLISELAKINGKTIAISSPNASEGKSTTSINIAITLSQLNKKVLIIDTDYRRATVFKKLKLENDLGLIEVISGKFKWTDAIKKYNSNLDVMTTGFATSEFSEMLISSDFDLLLTELSENYDYIILDTPPLNIVSDTSVIAQKCDALLLVVRSYITTYHAFRRSLSSIKQLDINLIGTIINGVDSSHRKNIYNKYGYGYGYYKNGYHSYY